MSNITSIFDKRTVERRNARSAQDLIDFAINELDHNLAQIEMAITLVSTTTLNSSHYTDEEKTQIMIQLTSSLQFLINSLKKEIFIGH
jgi:hypothetical protein